MKEKLLKIFMALAFVLCSYVFISIRLPSTDMYNLILTENARPEFEDFTTYGENYYKSGLISHFKEDLPQPNYKFRLSSKNSSLTEAKWLLFGDSHFDHSRQATFAERLKDSLQINVHLHRFRPPHSGNVLSYLKDVKYQNKGQEIMLYETSERYVIMRSEAEYQHIYMTSNLNKKAEFLKRIKNSIFNGQAEILYTVALQRSFFTSYFYSQIATLKFNYFKYINSNAPEYELKKDEDSWLFYGESVRYYARDDINDSLIKSCALNVKKLQSNLKTLYDLDLIYLIIPEKYTIYNIQHTDKPYHQFIPKFQKELKRLSIPYIDLYSDYVSSKEELYHRTDTHWNEEGVDIAVKKTLKYYKNLSE